MSEGTGNRIDRIFADLRANARKGLMPFVCGGHPQPGATALILPSLERAGASIVEIGIPFSDPIADGPVIAAAMHRALAKGATPGNVFEEVASIREWLKIGLVAMVSVSIAYRMSGNGGPHRFVQMLASAGFDGVIYPDLPIDEAESLLGATRDAGLTASLLVAPTTPAKRAEQIAKASSGFLYVLARTGVTGEQALLPNVTATIARLRQVTELPLAVGFGISTAEQVRAVVRPGDKDGADAAIVGSALVRRLGEAGERGTDPAGVAEEFVGELARGLTGRFVSSPAQQPLQQSA